MPGGGAWDNDSRSLEKEAEVAEGRIHKSKKASHHEEQQEDTPIPSPTRVSPLIIAPPSCPNSAWFEEDQQ